MNKQLEALANEFDAWRSKRVKRTATPDALIAKALSLRGVNASPEPRLFAAE
jgi:hypothetical protein